MAPPIRLSRSRASTSNLVSASTSTSPATPSTPLGESSRRSSNRAAAAKIYKSTEHLARYQDEQDDADEDEEDDEDAQGEDDEEEVAPSPNVSRRGVNGKGATTTAAASRSRAPPFAGTASARKQGRSLIRAAAQARPVYSGYSQGDQEEEGEEGEEEEDEGEPVADPTPPSTSKTRVRDRQHRLGPASRGKPRGRGRASKGGPHTSGGGARRLSDDEEDDTKGAVADGEDDDDVRPEFKKRPSRLHGFSLSLDNAQTLLARTGNQNDATGAADDKPKRKGRGRPRKLRSQPTRIIEDSEDEDSSDDRPRPRNPDEVEVDDDQAVPPGGRFKCKVMNTEYILDGDELELQSDAEGDKKIDANGNLLGGRIWKAAPFTSTMRHNPHKVYLLSVDAARAVGFRDSLGLFRSHLRLVKLGLLPQEKDDLIAAGRLNPQLRGRNVTMVTAKSVFKLFGAKTIKGGRAVIDDYYESAARAVLEKSGRHEEQGQVIEADDYRSQAERRRDADRERDRTRRPPDAHSTALYDFHGNLITTTFGDNGAPPFVRSSGWPSRRAAQLRADLTEENWMLEMARNVQGMNSELAENRKERLMKFTDPVEGVSEAYLEEQQGILAKHRASKGARPAMLHQLSQVPTRLQILSADQMEVDGYDAKAMATTETASLVPAIEPLAGDLVNGERPRGENSDGEEGENGGGDSVATEVNGSGDRYKDLRNLLAPPVGLYDPTTHLPHFPRTTQPTYARMEKIGKRPYFASAAQGGEEEEEDESQKVKKAKLQRQRQKPILLGSRIGRGAMGVASWSTVVDLGSIKDTRADVASIPAGLGSEEISGAGA